MLAKLPFDNYSHLGFKITSFLLILNLSNKSINLNEVLHVYHIILMNYMTNT